MKRVFSDTCLPHLHSSLTSMGHDNYLSLGGESSHHAEQCSPSGNGDSPQTLRLCSQGDGESPVSVVLKILLQCGKHGLWSPPALGPNPFPPAPFHKSPLTPGGLGPPLGGDLRPRCGGRDLLKATGRRGMGTRHRFFDLVSRALPSCHISQPSFWKPTWLAWTEWPAVAAHLPCRPLETWRWCLLVAGPEWRARDGCGAGQGQGALGWR